jgi:hypothetical protein
VGQDAKALPRKLAGHEEKACKHEKALQNLSYSAVSATQEHIAKRASKELQGLDLVALFVGEMPNGRLG